MESVRIDKLNSGRALQPMELAGTIKQFCQKVFKVLSLDADPIFKSKNWPNLWSNGTLSINKELTIKKFWSKRTARIFSWGLISLAMYLTVFLNQAMITKYFTEGGFFAVVVVITALAFAFVYGNFANFVLESLNFKAVNRNKDGH